MAIEKLYLTDTFRVWAEKFNATIDASNTATANAEEAINKANTATANAEEAINKANTATANAEEAINKANEALEKAESAQEFSASTDKLATARTIQTNLASTAAASFNGTANVTPGVTGVLPVANGGTGRTDGKAPRLVTKRTIDGVSFDGSANITHFGKCSTEAGTAAKVVSVTGFTLATGAEVTVQFTVTNTAASPTLNVNGTGAKAIVYRNAAISAGYLAANRVYKFVYDGTNYELIGDIDTNTTYPAASTSKAGIVQLNDTVTSTSTTLAATAHAVKLAYDKAVDALESASFNKEVIFTSSDADWKAPVSGVYCVTCIGGGGKGGAGGKGHGSNDTTVGGGGGGGGGGSGLIKTVFVTLTANTVVPITVGGPAGTSSFGTYVTSKGGLTGSAGKSGTASSSGAGGSVIHEGAAGKAASGRNGGNGGAGAPGYRTSVTASNGAAGSVSRPSTTAGTGGTGGKGYGAGGGGGGGGGQHQYTDSTTAGGAGGNGAAGAVIVRYTA